MFFDLVGLVRRQFSNPRIGDLYRDIRAYLPPDRFREFRRSWVTNNLIRGPRRRRRMERRHGCALPAIINVSPTEACNLRCRGCYASAYTRGLEMSEAQLEGLVSDARELGIHFIGLLGGEPLLRKDLLPLLGRHKDVAFRISTNGTLLDDEIVGWLKGLGNVVIFFSLEGFEADTDWWRGEGVYRRIVEGMRWLRQERVLFGFSALLHARNVTAVASPEFLDAMAAEGNRFGLFFPYGPVGMNQHFDLALAESEVSDAFERIDEMQTAYNMLLLKEGGCSPSRPGRTLEQGCRAGLTVHVTPDGNVEPCNGIQFHTENALEKGLLGVFCSPFYRAIHGCARDNDGRCIAIFEPAQVIDLVARHRARASNPAAIPCIERAADRRRGEIGRCHS